MPILQSGYFDMKATSRFLQLIVFLFSGLISQETWAADSSNDQDYLQEFPIVLSASRLLQPVSETPNAMTVIDRKMIDASGFRSLPDVFKLVPGMYVSYYGAQAIVSYHGSLSQDAQGMQVLIDGRSVYLPPANTVDWSLLPITLDDVERIEVVRGPAAASYGENSVHGVINIITRDAEAVNGTTVSNTRGNKGINDALVHFGKHGETLDYRMTLGYTADNGYDNLSIPPNNIPITQGQASDLINNTNDNNQARLMNYRASYHPNSTDDFDVQLGFNHDVMGVGFLDSHGGFNPFHNMISYSNTQQLGWLHRTDNSSEISVRYYHIQLDTDEDYQVSGFPVSRSIKSGRNELEFQYILQTAPTNRLVYGAGYRQDQVSSQIYTTLIPPGYFSMLNNAEEYRVFANDEWRYTPSLIINAGGMVESDAMGYKTFSPRASLNYHLNPTNTIRLGASVAHRTPALAEQLGSVLIDIPGVNSPTPGLQPEKLLSREIGYLGEFRDWGTSLDLRIFDDQLSNGIFPILILGSSSNWSNGMSGIYEGFEATVKHSLGEFSNLTFNFAHELAYSNIASLPGVSLPIPGQDALAKSIPKNSISLQYALRLYNNFSFSTNYYLQSSMQPFDRNVIDFQPTQHRTDIRISQSFKGVAGLSGEVSGVVQNLFKTDYTEYVATDLFNRRAFVTLTLHWQ